MFVLRGCVWLERQVSVKTTTTKLKLTKKLNGESAKKFFIHQFRELTASSCLQELIIIS